MAFCCYCCCYWFGTEFFLSFIFFVLIANCSLKTWQQSQYYLSPVRLIQVRESAYLVKFEQNSNGFFGRKIERKWSNWGFEWFDFFFEIFRNKLAGLKGSLSSKHKTLQSRECNELRKNWAVIQNGLTILSSISSINRNQSSFLREKNTKRKIKLKPSIKI